MVFSLNQIDSRRLLRPVVILVIPRFTNAAITAATMLAGFDAPKFAIGYYQGEGERENYYREWPDSSVPLLLLRGGATPAFEVVSAISERHQDQPVAILIADGPEVDGFKTHGGEIFCRELGGKVGSAFTDVQVFLYSPTWSSRPPRIR